MGQEVLDAFWKSNDRIYNENTLLYHRLARACGPAGLRLLAAVHPAVGGGAPDPDPVERAAVPTQADGEFQP